MKIKIKGIDQELKVRKTARILAEWQEDSGISLSDWQKKDAAVYGTPFAAWCALRNAGYEPKWDELIDRDLEDFEVIQEPGDTRDEKPGDVSDPPAPSLPDSSQDVVPEVAWGGQLSED